MTTHTHIHEFHFPDGWTAEDLAAAVPRHLHRLDAFDAEAASGTGPSANHATQVAPAPATFLPAPATLPLFRVVP